MGLHIHTLGNLNIDATRDYYVYMLDYGWHEPLAEAMRSNFTNMARMASKTNSVVIAGVEPVHFENEVFSFHGINGESGEEVLPALLITTIHPHYFQDHHRHWGENGELRDKLLLIPMKACCTTTTDVVDLIKQVFKDIEEKKRLDHFEVAKKINRNWAQKITDAVIVQPTFGGVGIDLKKIFG